VTDAPLQMSIDGSIARLRFNRPDAGNAIGQSMADALLDAAIRCDSDPAIRCVVLTGAGRFFCAGGDIGSFAGASADASAFLSKLAGTLHMAQSRFLRMAKPLLVLVNGPAAGAGMSLAIAGDIVIAAESAHFTAAYGGVGLTPDGGMSWLLPRHVGLRRAQEIILTNRRVAAAAAAELGLVTRIVPDEDLEAEGEVAAQALVNASAGSLAGARALLLESGSSSLEAQLERETRTVSAAGGTADFREGVAAFLARRKPAFTGIR